MARVRPESSTGLDLTGLETDFITIDDGVNPPSATAGQAKIYVDIADGNLKIIYGNGAVQRIVIVAEPVLEFLQPLQATAQGILAGAVDNPRLYFRL